MVRRHYRQYMPRGAGRSLHAAMELINFIVSYFLTKDLSMLTAFICWSDHQSWELHRSALAAGLRVALVTDFSRHPPLAPLGLFREAVLLDLACPEAASVLEKASSSRGFNYRHSWLLLHNSSYDSGVVEATLSAHLILPDADVVWAAADGLVDVYKVTLERACLQTRLGLTRNCSRRQLAALWGALPTAVSRRRDLQNVFLKGVTIISEPQQFRGWSDLHNRPIDTFPKLTYPLMMLAAQDLNFRYQLRQVDQYGVFSNGSFTGMVGLLQRHRADLGLASLFIRHDRLLAVDYFSETYVLSSPFIFRQPSRSAVSNVFLLPFSGGVWAASAGVAGAAALLLAALRRAPAAPAARGQLLHLTLPDTCTFALATLCQQGFHITPAVSSVRVVMFSTLLMALFVFTAYSAKIVAILQAPSNALQTIDDLVRSPMTIGVQQTSYKKIYFLESSDHATQQLYRRKIVPQGERAFHSIEAGMARVRNGYFAFLVERTSGYDIITQTFTEREKCSLNEIEAFKLPIVAIPITKNSGYRELFAVRMRWQREVGLMDRERRVWLVARPRCEQAGGGFVSVGIIDVLPALQVLAIGASVAVLLLGAELGVHAVKRKTVTYRQRQRHAMQQGISHAGTSRVLAASGKKALH